MSDTLLNRTTATRDNALSTDERDAFLTELRIGRLATMREDGWPHVTPIWYVWEDGRFLLSLGKSRRHLRNIAGDPHVTPVGLHGLAWVEHRALEPAAVLKHREIVACANSAVLIGQIDAPFANHGSRCRIADQCECQKASEKPRHRLSPAQGFCPCGT